MIANSISYTNNQNAKCTSGFIECMCEMIFHPTRGFIYFLISDHSEFYWYHETQFWPSGRVLANGPGDWSSVFGQVIPKTQKWYLIPPCLTLSITRYVSRVKGINQEKGVALSLTLWCSSEWKGSFQVALDYGWLPTLLITCFMVEWTETKLAPSPGICDR